MSKPKKYEITKEGMLRFYRAPAHEIQEKNIVKKTLLRILKRLKKGH